MGFFDEVICRNLEDGKTVLSPAEGALCARARLVLATGALSYITPATLSKVSAHWETAPVFLFFPLVATDVTGVVLTKLDGSAKGGIVFAVETELGIPVKVVGVPVCCR